MKLPDCIVDDPGVMGVAVRRLIVMARVATGQAVMYRCALTTLGPALIRNIEGREGRAIAVTESTVMMKPIHAGSMGEIQREISADDLMHTSEDLN